MKRLIVALLLLSACNVGPQPRGGDRDYADRSKTHRYENGVTEFTMPNGILCYVLYTG